MSDSRSLGAQLPFNFREALLYLLAALAGEEALEICAFTLQRCLRA